MLEGGRFAAEVRADQEAAMDRGVTGVPFFLVGGKFGVPGAQAPETLLRVLDRAWSDLHPATVRVEGAAGPACEGDACAF